MCIHTFGGLAAEHSERPITGFHSRKVEALLVYLACTGRPHPREVLAEQTLKPLVALPASFAFAYDHARLLPTRSYGLEAELWSQGARLFRTDTQYRVSPDGPAAKADLVLVREP